MIITIIITMQINICNSLKDFMFERLFMFVSYRNGMDSMDDYDF